MKGVRNAKIEFQFTNTGIYRYIETGWNNGNWSRTHESTLSMDLLQSDKYSPVQAFESLISKISTWSEKTFRYIWQIVRCRLQLPNCSGMNDRSLKTINDSLARVHRFWKWFVSPVEAIFSNFEHNFSDFNWWVFCIRIVDFELVWVPQSPETSTLTLWRDLRPLIRSEVGYPDGPTFAKSGTVIPVSLS
jgi:hypothetical protein